MRVRRFALQALCLVAVASGCATLAPRAAPGRAVALSNPFFIPAQNAEGVWERSVDVIHDYFEIARENRLDGVIETQPKVGAGVLEPWHKDSVGLGSRLESSLQSIRRRAFINITPTDGGFLVGVEVFKELEDVTGIAEQTAGGATFQEAQPLQRDLTLVVGQSAPSGWIPQGRDDLLEHTMLNSLHASLSK